jgi:hypothetical protein
MVLELLVWNYDETEGISQHSRLISSTLNLVDAVLLG